MISKKGMLAIDEIIKLVLGIAVFIFILFILFAFGKIVSNSLREEQAQRTLENVVYEISKLPETDDKDLVIEGPTGWFFYSHADNFCFLPMSCLELLNKSSLLSKEEVAAGIDNIIPICKSSGFCNSNMNVTIPYDYIDYKTGSILNYYAQYLFGSSELVMADIFHSLLICEGIVPQTIKIRKLNNVTTMIGVPSTKELSLIVSIITKANELPVGNSADLSLVGAEKEYLSSARISGQTINLICLCSSKDKIVCEKSGLCMVSGINLVLVEPIRMPKTNPNLRITKIDENSFRVSLI